MKFHLKHLFALTKKSYVGKYNIRKKNRQKYKRWKHLDRCKQAKDADCLNEILKRKHSPQKKEKKTTKAKYVAYVDQKLKGCKTEVLLM